MTAAGERGAVALLVLAGGATLLTAALFVLSVVADVGITAARARTAADAAALAAVATAPLLGGDGNACPAAAHAAEANDARVVRCELGEASSGSNSNPGVLVEVEARPRSPITRTFLSSIPARAAAALRPRDALTGP